LKFYFFKKSCKGRYLSDFGLEPNNKRTSIYKSDLNNLLLIDLQTIDSQYFSFFPIRSYYYEPPK